MKIRINIVDAKKEENKVNDVEPTRYSIYFAPPVIIEL